jgi:heavy metal sensor kinase
MLIKTFRLRLTILYAAAVVMMFSFFALAIYGEYKKEIQEAVDGDLLEAAKTAVQKGPASKTTARDEEIIRRYGDEYFQIISRNGDVVIASMKGDSSRPPNRALMIEAFKGVPKYETAVLKGENYRTLYYPVSEDTIVRVGVSLEDTDREIDRLQRLFIIFLPFIVVFSLLASWFLAGKSLDPVIKIKSLAKKVRQGKMKERIDIGLKGKEIDDLVTIFNEMLESIANSVEAQKRFTSDVSHEVRSPLSSLRSSIEVTLRRRREPGEYEDILRNNLADVIRLSKITDNLLFLARADHNIMQIRRQWFHVERFIQSVVERLNHQVLSAGISIVEDYQKDLEFYGDADLLEQAFSNLINNAIKFTPPGGKVEARAHEEDGAVVVTISDSGIGIPEEDIPHIFERFYRVNKERSRKSGGTGLGLAITQWIINAHKGTIAVRSKVGSGSEFIVMLPKSAD